MPPGIFRVVLSDAATTWARPGGHSMDPCFSDPDLLISLIRTLCLFEDIRLGEEQARELLQIGRSSFPGLSGDDELIVSSVRDTLAFLGSRENRGMKADLALFLRLNALLAREQALIPGVLRNGPVFVPSMGEVPPPDPRRVEAEIDRLNSLGSGNCALEAAGCFCRLARMQPFWDGNKRTALTLCSVMLMRHGSGPLAVPEEEYALFDELLTSFYTRKDESLPGFLAMRCRVPRNDS